MLNVKPRHEVENKRYLYHSKQFHGFEQMATMLPDLCRNFENSGYLGIYIKKPVGIDIKEIIKVSENQNESASKNTTDFDEQLLE